MHGSFLAKDMSYVASFISMNENCTMYHPKILCINGQTDRMIDRQTDGWQVSLNITNIQGYKKQETFQKKKSLRCSIKPVKTLDITCFFHTYIRNEVEQLDYINTSVFHCSWGTVAEDWEECPPLLPYEFCFFAGSVQLGSPSLLDHWHEWSDSRQDWVLSTLTSGSSFLHRQSTNRIQRI